MQQVCKVLKDYNAPEAAIHVIRGTLVIAIVVTSLVTGVLGLLFLIAFSGYPLKEKAQLLVKSPLLL